MRAIHFVCSLVLVTCSRIGNGSNKTSNETQHASW